MSPSTLSALVAGCVWTSFSLGNSSLSAAENTNADPAPAPHRVYSHLLQPREHPDYSRRAVQPPDWATFGGKTRFTTLRGFAVEGDRITGYAEELEKFTRTHDLGEVIWPSYPILFATNLAALAEEIRRRDLFLFDVWGYVPGSGPGGYWQQFRVPAAALSTLETVLGERWLGTDIGEQDGRYIGGYANQMTPASGDRFEQYRNFQEHFEAMGDDLGHKHATLVSLNFGHYLLKEGTYTLIGAETAQALPNNQVYYAFIRGAGKQYGVPWFGNASIFNRWGFKTYGSSGKSEGYEHGPTKGTSLSLLKRLLYTHILYNCVAVGFENGWLDGNELSPIGRIQKAAKQWVAKHGQPGVMHTPVALLLDFDCGWSFPRHLYSENIYRVWGNLPYAPGDYLTDGILDLLYPGYQDASYFHDESGFISATPYGDIADCLLSDAPPWLLARYPVMIAAGELRGGRELQDKLRGYVEGGGRLFLTRGNLAKLPRLLDTSGALLPGASVNLGQGSLTLLAEDFGVSPTDIPGIKSEVDRPLAKPDRLDADLRARLDGLFRSLQLFEVDNPKLAVVACRRAAGEYVLGLANNTWQAQPFAIRSRIGEMSSVEELALDTSERGAPGWLPEGVTPASVGENTATTIAGGDIRIFRVRVNEKGVEEIAHVAPPARPLNRYLRLDPGGSLKRELLRRPTFFEHFDGVVIASSYLSDKEAGALEREGRWLRRQNVRVAVDLSSELNLFPALRLVDNETNAFARSLAIIEGVLRKMPALGASNLLVSLHRHPENNFTGTQADQAFEKSLRTIADRAAAANVTVHLRMTFGKPPWDLGQAARLVAKVGRANLRLAPATALLPDRGPTAEELQLLKNSVGAWLIAEPRRDLQGRVWDAHAPAHSMNQDRREKLQVWLRTAPGCPLIVDSVPGDLDAEYLEARALDGL